MPDLGAYHFTKTHEWVRDDGAGEVSVGISDHAQAQLGDVIFLELPQPGTAVEAGERFGAVESVKAASDLVSPVTGEVIAVNDRLTEAPETVNSDPHGEGWLLRVRVSGELPADLMDATAYAAFADAEAH